MFRWLVGNMRNDIVRSFEIVNYHLGKAVRGKACLVPATVVYKCSLILDLFTLDIHKTLLPTPKKSITIYEKQTSPLRKTSATMNAIKNAGNYVSSKTKGSAREASKEANKQYVGPNHIYTTQY